MASASSEPAPLPPTSPRNVHFSTECAVIPDDVASRQRRPRLTTKTVSLPLWRRRVPSSDEPPEGSEEGDVVTVHLREEVVSVKVSIPSFRTRSTSRERISSSSSPPTPILRHSTSSAATTSPLIPTRQAPQRRPSLPTPRVSSSPLVPTHTVPLRPCCADCAPAVEEALAAGGAWCESFTRGARRRRSLSVDSAHASTAPASFAAIRVDEVGRHVRAPSPPPSPLALTSSASLPSKLGPSLTRRTPSGASSVGSSGDPALVIDLSEPLAVPMPKTHTVSAIQEEEEDEQQQQQTTRSVPPSPLRDDDTDLFPLPSPRRSPAGSPLIPSPAGSTTHLDGSSAHCKAGAPISPAVVHALQRANASADRLVPARVRTPDGSPRRVSPAGSPGIAYRTPAAKQPQPHAHAPHSQHHSWSAFFKAGADVLRGVNSIAG